MPDGTDVPVSVRCDRVSAPGDTYLLVARSLDEERSAALERERLVYELSQANHRLSGTLKIVLGTLDAQDMGTLFGHVLEELRDTMEATGTIVYLAENDGFRLRGLTSSLGGANVPQFLPYGLGVATLATKAGHALRLRIEPPDTASLRSGAPSSRWVVEESSTRRHKVSARLLPPFASFICVPVWFGDHVIAILQVGWDRVHAMGREDSRLLDSVAKYLALEIAAAFAAMRSERKAELDERIDECRQMLVHSGGTTTESVMGSVSLASDALSAAFSVVHENRWQKAFYARLPGLAEDRQIPFDLLTLEENYLEDGVAVVPILPGDRVSRWLAEHEVPSIGAFVDIGIQDGDRRCAFVLRGSYDEPFDEDELVFLHHMADIVRDAIEGEATRVKETRISQALQSGMKNELQKVDGISTQDVYSSATEAASVGGDFYDLIRLPERKACIVLGDVSGKGIEAASVSAAVKAALEAYAWEGLAPAHMVRALNDFLMGFSRLETFATMFVGVVDLAAGTLTYCSAGHPPALLLRAATGELETLAEQSGVVGAFHGMAYHDGRVDLSKGDLLLLYTDGVTEARTPAGAFFGEDGLRDAVMQESAEGVDGILGRLLERIDAFTARQLDDDVAMVAMRFDKVGRRRARKARASSKAEPEGRDDVVPSTDPDSKETVS
ncbi:MAG: SpoIIE family protein phosphatase [Atopobiaceae bacterium]|jgi:serine phosphatase RsbU (regulator of sigma subunit)|nr:SpoIIE family protein phosphatase [Atopobiaceae bacterium]